MKRFILLLVLVFALGSANANYQIEDDIYTVIMLSSEDEPDRDVGNKDLGGGSRSLTQQPIFAYTYNKVVNIEFIEVFSMATISITNQTTGEIIYSGVYTMPDSLAITLDGKSSGNYVLSIETNTNKWVGEFSL